MRIVSFSEARNKLKSVLDQFNGLMETVHLLKSPANAAHLDKSIKQYQKGQVKQHEITDVLA